MDPILSLPQYRDHFTRRNASKSRKRDGKPCHPDLSDDGDPYACKRCRHACLESSHCFCQQEHAKEKATSCDVGHKLGPCPQRKTQFSHEYGQHIDNSGQHLQRLAALFSSQILTDIRLIVGSRTYDVHKLILCCGSDVFRVMLTNPSWPESKRDKIVLREEPECEDVFDDFLKYLYSGTIHLTHSTALPVLMLADKYNVVDLQHVCADYMSSHLVSTVQQNRVVSWFQYANLCGHWELAKNCQNFILWNFHKVVCTSDYYNCMEKEYLIFFLGHSELLIPDEYTLFKGITYWIMHQITKFHDNIVEYKQCAQEVLSCVRFPMMTPQQLGLLEQDPCASLVHDFFVENVVQALTYHSCTTEERSRLVSLCHNPDAFKPRNYTNDVWSTTLSIEDFLVLPTHEVRPLFFSSPLSGAQADENYSWEWNLDLYPKGIQFEKCILIGLWRNLEVGGATYDTVRLVLETKVAESRTVDVAVLVTGVQDSVEYIKTVVERRCIFDCTQRVCHVNNIVPFEELNVPDSPYLSGPDNSTFTITIIVKPA